MLIRINLSGISPPPLSFIVGQTIIVNREAYHDAVRKGHELTKKIHSERNEESVDQSSGSLAATLEEMEQDQGGKLQQVEGKYSNLLKMEFMQRAIVKQREKLREEAVGAWVDDNLKVADISVAGKWDEKERHNYESRSKDSTHIEKSPVLTTSFDFHLQKSIVSKRDHQQRDNVVKPSLSGVQQVRGPLLEWNDLTVL